MVDIRDDMRKNGEEGTEQGREKQDQETEKARFMQTNSEQHCVGGEQIIKHGSSDARQAVE